MKEKRNNLRKILNTAQPVPQISDNVVEFIIKKLKETDCDIFVEYGAGNSTRFFLKHLLQLEKKCLFISVECNYFWFMETLRAIRSDLKSIPTSEDQLQLKPWTLEKCKRYLSGNNATSLDVPEDLRRLPKAKRILGGPLNIKILLYMLSAGSRPHDGYYSVKIGNSLHFLLFLRSEFIKDQYGESPIKKEYIDTTLEPIRQKLLSEETLVAAFLVDGGPRGDILDSIFDLEDSNNGFHPTVFLCEAHRSYYADPIRRRPSGVFIQGSNITLNGEPAYKREAAGKKAEFTYGRARASPEDLAEREMWFYESN
jgi:hypothetical protein